MRQHPEGRQGRGERKIYDPYIVSKKGRFVKCESLIAMTPFPRPSAGRQRQTVGPSAVMLAAT
nr:MAG TPA: hypothetical protein [Caudoviricetes sp.]